MKTGIISPLAAAKMSKESLEKAKMIARQQKHPISKIANTSTGITTSKQLNVQSISSGPSQKAKPKAMPTNISKSFKPKTSQAPGKPAQSLKSTTQPSTSKSQVVDDDDVICID